jgi:uncharacterized membrane protein
VKKVKLVEEADKALVKELGIPGKFLAPTWYVDRMVCNVGVHLQWFVLPYTKEIDDMAKKKEDVAKKIKEIEAKEEEFRKVLPMPVREMLHILGRGPGIMPFHPLMGFFR